MKIYKSKQLFNKVYDALKTRMPLVSSLYLESILGLKSKNRSKYLKP